METALHFTLATAGHVDHGKTSVLRGLTGIDPDRLKEEKEREMTIDLGFANFRVGADEIAKMNCAFPVEFCEKMDGKPASEAELVIGFVDVPGHGKFLKNMLAGVGGIDMALLVVAADEGVMPQTIQHVKILTLLGVRECILVLNKVDLAEPESKEIATIETHELLERLGITVLDTVPVSCSNGDGIAELKETIVKRVLALPSRDRRHDVDGKDLPSFLSIDRVFSKAGFGAVVTGTLTRGSIAVGDEIFIEPGAIGGKVRGLQTFNRKLERAFPGQRLAINLSLKENKPIERGQAVIGAATPPVQTMIVQITDLGGLESSKDTFKKDALKPQPIRFYHGTAERYGDLRWCEKLSDGSDGTGVERDLKQPVIGQLFLTEPVVAAPGERYVIRHGDFGIAGGEILLTARPRWLNREMLKNLMTKVLHGSLDDAAHELINLSPQKSLGQDLVACLLPENVRGNVVSDLLAKGTVEKLGDQFITKSERDELTKRILDELEKAAQTEERDKSVSQEKLKVKIAPLVDRAIFQNIIKDLLAKNLIAKTDEKISLPSAVPKDTAGGVVSPLMEKILEVLDKEFCLEIDELSTRVGAPKPKVVDALTQLEKDGKAAVINYDFASGSSAILQAHKALAKVWQQQKNISPGDFREQVGTSRKYAMALLAYFDDHQITRRLPSGRVLLKQPG